MTNKLDKKEITGMAALLIHAAKIDEIYSEKEKKIVLNFIQKNLDDVSISEKLLNEAEKLEADSNQLLSFTKIIKESDKELKKEIIEQLWKILISDNNVDQYESNLMRRICGLIYFPDKECAEIKLKLLDKK